MKSTRRVPPIEEYVDPLAAAARYSVTANIEVLLNRRGQVRRIVPQNAAADAHARRNEVPQIPFTKDHSVAMKLSGIDVGRASVTGHVDPLEVRAHQDGAGGIYRAGEPALGAPQEEIVTDLPAIGAFFPGVVVRPMAPAPSSLNWKEPIVRNR